ncbi:MAG: cysteine hydrolase family protein [Gemmatimonadetes bacterium]|nr:cysteine hydrolase family protein [Gemmatimonadota bacterium]
MAGGTTDHGERITDNAFLAGIEMAGLIFWDVDTQYDFMRADGKLYVPDAERIIPNLAQLTGAAHQHGIRVVASADDHVPGHRELSDAPDFKETFPPHCMRGTAGQRKIPETALTDPLVIEPEPLPAVELTKRVRRHDGDILFHKHWFDVFTNPNVEPVVRELDPERIVLYGVALDVCDKYAIEGLLQRRPHTQLYVVTDAMKPIDAKQAERLLGQWQQRGVELVTTTDAIALARRRAESAPAQPG